MSPILCVARVNRYRIYSRQSRHHDSGDVRKPTDKGHLRAHNEGEVDSPRGLAGPANGPQCGGWGLVRASPRRNLTTTSASDGHENMPRAGGAGKGSTRTPGPSAPHPEDLPRTTVLDSRLPPPVTGPHRKWPARARGWQAVPRRLLEEVEVAVECEGTHRDDFRSDSGQSLVPEEVRGSAVAGRELGGTDVGQVPPIFGKMKTAPVPPLSRGAPTATDEPDSATWKPK